MSIVCYPPGTDWSCSGFSEEEIAELDADRVALAEGLAWMSLMALTGGQIAYCPVTVRPCAIGCGAPPTWMVAPVLSSGRFAGVRPGVYAFAPHVSASGAWVNGCGCGSPRDCSCSSLSEVLLPGPIGDIVEVRLDGAVLSPDAYRVDSGNRLVRVDGDVWPACQDLGAPGPDPGPAEAVVNFEPDGTINVSWTGTLTFTRVGDTVTLVIHATSPTDVNPYGNTSILDAIPEGFRVDTAASVLLFQPPDKVVQVAADLDDAQANSVSFYSTVLIPAGQPFEATVQWQAVPPTTTASTFAVTYYMGEAPNNVTLAAAGALAGQWYKACGGEPCSLPANAIAVSRQGVSMELEAGIFPGGKTNIPIVDALIDVYNPHGLRSAPVIASPDTRRMRITTGG